MEVGTLGQFDVLAEGEIVASKQTNGALSRLFGGGFPKETDVVSAIRARVGSI